MKSIKPGRGPSAMGGIGSIFSAVFGVIWTMAAVSMGAPWFFALFGVLFIVMALIQAAYNMKNATSEERFSEYDIVDSSEEGDPAERLLKTRAGEETAVLAKTEDQAGGGGEGNPSREAKQGVPRRFCPYCGAPVEADYRYCSSCGKELP